MKYSYAEFVPIFKALSDETRLKIVHMLSSGELCACKILGRFSITQPTLSYHMKILTECKIVVGVKNGAWMNYRLNQESLEMTNEFLKSIIINDDECPCRDDGCC